MENISQLLNNGCREIQLKCNYYFLRISPAPGFLKIMGCSHVAKQFLNEKAMEDNLHLNTLFITDVQDESLRLESYVFGERSFKIISFQEMELLTVKT